MLLRIVHDRGGSRRRRAARRTHPSPGPRRCGGGPAQDGQGDEDGREQPGTRGIGDIPQPEETVSAASGQRVSAGAERHRERLVRGRRSRKLAWVCFRCSAGPRRTLASAGRGGRPGVSWAAIVVSLVPDWTAPEGTPIRGFGSEPARSRLLLRLSPLCEVMPEGSPVEIEQLRLTSASGIQLACGDLAFCVLAGC